MYSSHGSCSTSEKAVAFTVVIGLFVAGAVWLNNEDLLLSNICSNCRGLRLIAPDIEVVDAVVVVVVVDCMSWPVWPAFCDVYIVRALRKPVVAAAAETAAQQSCARQTTGPLFGFLRLESSG